MATKVHPCQNCGACCTTYRVSFPVAETKPESFKVPVRMTFQAEPGTLALKHKNPANKRCSALEGHVGEYVSCGIYENRPSPCRKFQASYENGTPNPRCDECRSLRGMRPLTLEDWTTSENDSISQK